MDREKILFHYNIKKEAKLFLLWSFICFFISAISLTFSFAFSFQIEAIITIICFFLIAGTWFFILFLFGRNYQIRITKEELIFTAIFKTKRYRLKDLKKFKYRPLKNKWYVFEIQIGKDIIKPVTRKKQELKGLLDYFLNKR